MALGRTRSPEDVRWGPRRIDLDILWIEGLAMESDRLVVPHPRLAERAFALRPLVDVAPDAIDPISQLPYARLFDEEAARPYARSPGVDPAPGRRSGLRRCALQDDRSVTVPVYPSSTLPPSTKKMNRPSY